MCEVGMPSAFAKSGPSGITIMKSRMLTNCTAATSKTTLRSLAVAGAGCGATSAGAGARSFTKTSPFSRRARASLARGLRGGTWRACGGSVEVFAARGGIDGFHEGECQGSPPARYSGARGFGFGRASERQANREASAAEAVVAAHREAAVELLDDFFRDGEAETGAVAGFRSEEGVEDARGVGFADADAVVGDLEHGGAAFAAQAHADDIFVARPG